MILHITTSVNFAKTSGGLTKRSLYYSKRDSQDVITITGKISQLRKGVPTIAILDENDGTWRFVKIKENVWKMLRDLSPTESNVNEDEKYLTGASKNKYFRVA